jgi:hypothetical protein
MKQRIVVYIDDRPVFDAEGSFHFQLQNDWREIRFNPTMAAALAGASPEDIADLPGETVEMLLVGRNIQIDGSITKMNEIVR